MDNTNVPRVRNLTVFTYGFTDEFIDWRIYKEPLDYTMLTLEELEFGNRRSKKLSRDNDYFNFIKSKLENPINLIKSQKEILDLRVLDQNDLLNKQEYVLGLINQLDDIKKFLNEKFDFILKDKYKKFYCHLRTPEVIHHPTKWPPTPEIPRRYKTPNIIDFLRLDINNLDIDKEDKEFIEKNYNLLERRDKMVEMTNGLSNVEFLQRCKLIYEWLHYYYNNIFLLIKTLKADLEKIHKALEKVYKSRSSFQEKLLLVDFESYRDMIGAGDYNDTNYRHPWDLQVELKVIENQYQEYKKFWMSSNVLDNIRENEQKFLELNKISQEEILDDEKLRGIINEQRENLKKITRTFKHINNTARDEKSKLYSSTRNLRFKGERLRTTAFHPTLLLNYSTAKTLDEMLEVNKENHEYNQQTQKGLRLRLNRDNGELQLEEIEDREETELPTTQQQELEKSLEIPIKKANDDLSIEQNTNNNKTGTTSIQQEEVITQDEQISALSHSRSNLPSHIFSNSTIEETNIIVYYFKVIINFLSCHRLFQEINRSDIE